MKREPILIITAVNVFVQSVVIATVCFFPDWAKQEMAAVIGVIALTFDFAAAFFARSLVTPVSSPCDNEGNEVHN